MKTVTALLCLLLPSCDPSTDSKPDGQIFQKGDIVEFRLTGEKAMILGRRSSPFVYGTVYAVRVADGQIRDVHPYEITLKQPR